MTAPRVSPGNRITIWLQSVNFLDGRNERSMDSKVSGTAWKYGSTGAADSFQRHRITPHSGGEFKSEEKKPVFLTD